MRTIYCTVRVTLAVANWLVAHPLPAGITLNLNTPHLPYDQLKGWRWVPLAQRLYDHVDYEYVAEQVGADHLSVQGPRLTPPRRSPLTC